MTTVTIGMPVYNGAATVRAALNSLLSQSFGDFILIISDNCSTDETGTICGEFAARDERIRYTRQPATLAATMNFRHVLFEARTAYFMWAAADDLWAPGFIATHLEVLERDPKAVASQSRVLFTVRGVVSHLATGTYTLPYDARRNVVLFFSNPADNSRYYGLFRTEPLRASFPDRNFFALDWAVSAATLRFGTHVEVPDVLMIRDSSDTSAYGNAVGRDHQFVLWRIFPALFMTKWLLTQRSVPITPALLHRLTRVNIYLHCLFGQYHSTWMADRYLKTNSLRATARLALAETLGTIRRARVGRGVPVDRPGAHLPLARLVWRALPLTLRQREVTKRGVLRLLGSPPGAAPASGDTAANGGPMGLAPPVAPPVPQALPASGWRMPRPLAGRPPAAAVIIVAHGDVLGTLAQIDALAAVQGELPLEIAVVDNSSADVTALLGQICSGVILVRHPRTTPYGEAAMAGVRAVTAERLIFLGQKVLAQANFPRDLLAALESVETAGPRSQYPDGRLRAAGGVATPESGVAGIGSGESSSDPDYLYARDVDFCPAAFGILRQTLDAIGGLSASYRSFAITSLDVAVRVHAKGGQVLYWPSAVVTDYSEDDLGGTDVHLAPEHCTHDWYSFLSRNDWFVAARQWQGPGSRCSLDRSRAKRLLFIDAVTPTPDQNAGSIYVVNLMRMLGDLGFRVTFIPENNFAYYGKYTEQLQAQGVHAIYHPFYSSVQDTLERFGGEFDVVVASRIDIGGKYFDMIRELAPRARLVFNTIDLHALRAIREAELAQDPVRLNAARALWDTELAAVAKADATIVVSTYEKELLDKELPAANVHVIPLIADTPEQLDVPGFAARRDLMFVGTYQHPPNHDAVTYFVRTIWPDIRSRLPGARFLVVGSSVTPEIEKLAGDGVDVLGFVEDLDSLLAVCRVMVAPLRFGAGLKGKVVSSLQVGLPVVATDIAVEGTTLVNEQHVLVANTSHDFADAVVRLYTDQTLWEDLSKAGFAYVRHELSIGRSLQRLRLLLASIGVVGDGSEMRLELAAADPLYRPSAFWETLNERNARAIEQGLHSFKQTINNNYYQWLPGDFNDNQVRNLMAFWGRQPSFVPLEVLTDSGPGHGLTGAKGFNGDNPFDNPRYFRFYAFFVGLLWDYATRHDPLGLHQRLEEPLLGGPILLMHGDRRISQDLANSLHEWSRIRTLAGSRAMPEKPRILELGAGYGRLAYVFLMAQPCHYVIVDIPPALMVAQRYLECLFPDRKLFKFRHFTHYDQVANDLEAADISFLTSNQLPLLPPAFADISASISSLHEMRFDQIANYKVLLEEKTKSVIYLKQWTSWTNPSDSISVGREDFILGASWQLVLDCPHPVHDAMTELGFVRKIAVLDAGVENQSV